MGDRGKRRQRERQREGENTNGQMERREVLDRPGRGQVER